MTKAIASAVLILALLSACASTEGSGHYQGKLKPKTVYVVSDRTLDDFTIHHAIIAELQKRGFRVIDSRDQAPVSPGNALVLHYLDTWSWDWLVTGIMYLSAMNIRIVDNASEVLASAQFNAPVNSFSTSHKVVANMFAQLDQQNQPLVAAAN